MDLLINLINKAMSGGHQGSVDFYTTMASYDESPGIQLGASCPHLRLRLRLLSRTISTGKYRG